MCEERIRKKKNQDGILERDLWDKRVDVSFQSNVWVDAETNLYGLMKAKSVLEQYDEAVQFEDNLSSHKTDTVNEFWDSSKCYRKLYPPELTQVLQPIDRHIGIQYKSAVYQVVRSQSMKLLR